MTPEQTLDHLSFLDRPHVVGGAVRDRIIGLEAGDIDVASATPPDEAVRRCEARHIPVHETGIGHGTVTAIIGGTPVEITTFRCDVSCDGRRATVRFSDSIEEDLGRRDLTINAMALSPGGRIVDPHGGRADCEAGVVRCVDDPLRRFREDLLRPLRAARFSARLGFTIAPGTLQAMREVRGRVLGGVSTERVLDEIRKALSQCEDPAPFVYTVDDMGWLRPLFNGSGRAQVRHMAEHARLFDPRDRFAFLAGALERDGALERLPVSREERSLGRAVNAAWACANGTPHDEADRRLFQHRHGEALPALRRADGYVDEALTHATDVQVEPLITGQDLIDRGVEPGPAVGAALRAAHLLQLREGTEDEGWLAEAAMRTYAQETGDGDDE